LAHEAVFNSLSVGCNSVCYNVPIFVFEDGVVKKRVAVASFYVGLLKWKG